MRKKQQIFAAKFFAAVSILISAVVLFVCFVQVRNYYDVYEPKGLEPPSLLYIILTLSGFAILSAISAILFMLNKKIGWWLVTCLTGLIVVANIIPIVQMDFNPPKHITARTIAPIFFLVYYFSFFTLCLTKKVRKHFNVYRKPEEEIPNNI